MAKAKMTTCKVCGAEVASSAETCPNCGARLKKKKNGCLGSVLLVFGLLLIIGGIFGTGDGEVKPASDKAGTTTAQTPQEEQKEYYAVGEGAELKGVTVTLTDVKESKGSSFTTPSQGNVYVVCEFLIENGSDREIAVSSLMSFAAYCGDYSTNMSIGAMTSDNRGQLDGKVAPGKKMSGIIGYELPADWQRLEIEYSPSFWGKAMKFVATK